MIFYALTTALASIMIHSTVQKISPLMSAGYTFLFCIIGYSFFATKPWKNISLIKEHIYPITMLNVTTAICWIFSFLSLEYLSPELYLFTYLCAMPISGAVLFRGNLRKSCLLLIGLIFLFLTYRNYSLLPGILLAFTGGCSGTIYSIYSKKIIHHFTTLEILSFRFYLTVIITFSLSIFLGQWLILSAADYGKFALLSLISAMIPLALFQIGLKNLPIAKALSYMPLAPLLCYFINLLLGHDQFHFIQFIAVLFLFASMLL